jgi:hypothetical protein
MLNAVKNWFPSITVLSGVIYIWTLSLMARNVNRVLPPGVAPFSVIVVRQRVFQLIQLHRQLFPKSSLPAIVVLSVLMLVASAFMLSH